MVNRDCRAFLLLYMPSPEAVMYFHVPLTWRFCIHLFPVCIYVCVCLCVHVYLCVYACVCASLLCVHMRICVYARVYVCVRECAGMCTYMYFPFLIQLKCLLIHGIFPAPPGRISFLLPYLFHRTVRIVKIICLYVSS